MWDHSPWKLLLLGGPVMWPLLAASIIGLALMLDRALVFAWSYQNFQRIVGALRPLVLDRDWTRAERLCQGSGPLTSLALIYLQQRRQSAKVREDILQREGGLLLGRLERRLRWLAINGQLSPMLGLLGTVTGLVSAFHQVEMHSGAVQASNLAAGIWEALLTTVFGLVIAIPCMTAYHAFESRLETISRQFTMLVSYLDQWCLEGRPAKAAADLEPAPVTDDITGEHGAIKFTRN